MQPVAIFSATIRKTQTLRIILIIVIFFLLASVSRYQGSFEYSIDEDGQVQSVPSEASEHNVHYTHHIATYDPKDLKDWTKGDTEALRTIAGQNIVKSLTGTKFKRLSPEERGRIELDPSLDDNKRFHALSPLKDDHFLTLTKRLRVFRALWQHLQSYHAGLEVIEEDEESVNGRHFYEGPPSDLAPAIDLLQKIEQTTFPWLLKRYETTFDLFEETKGGGRGIVMSVGNWHAKYARTTVKHLREVLGCTLPIEIYYSGAHDLVEEHRNWFERIENVRTIDLTTLIDNELLRLGGWAAKPFMMLMTRFEEVMMLDSDAAFFQDPEVLFDDDGYKEVGTVFFYDRTVFPGAGGDKKQWMESFLPTMSNHPAKSRWFRSKGDHEMESGVVVLDKGRHFLGMLAICAINDYYEREQVTYVRTWGDKETFWIALEMIQERYSFLRYGGGVLGNWGDMISFWNENLPADEIELYNKGETQTTVHPINIKDGKQRTKTVSFDRVCGNLAHFDYRGKPLWWNSGLVVNKYMANSPYLKYNAYMRDEDGIWNFDTNCMVQQNPGAVMELDWEQRQAAFELLKVDRAVAVEIVEVERSFPNYKEIVTIPALIRTEAPKGGHGNNQAV
ncbi:hypothetical protein EMPS_05260 [Entomortierella parvispora]|uniref:Alpha-1,3-mannosyltransferase n=1 Tax=Entomortierella parvispora TaxID=205924 RepID=A0A9P3HAS5_9FUNG|nr:hypothetical protein EMPS_05260 [Entomortierella parvispora]